MISKTIDDVIQNIEEMITILDKSEITSLMTEERAIGARIAYLNGKNNNYNVCKYKQ